jgi:hypothetical protein
LAATWYEYYGLYHFLNDLEGILDAEKDDRRHLQE